MNQSAGRKASKWLRGPAFAMVMSLMLLVTFTPTVGFAANTDSGVKATTTDIFDFVDSKSKKSLKKASQALPDHIDLTDGYVTGFSDARNVSTPVKSQYPFGTCWGFAATAAAEGSVIGEKAAKGEKVDVRDSDYDFSEKYLAWFTSSYIQDEDNDQYGEGVHWVEGTTSSRMYNAGGMPFNATQQYASGIGPTLEKDYPYKGKNGNIDKKKVNGKIVNVSYSKEDDWAIDESERYHQHYQLEESYMLPSPAGKDSNGNYEYNEAGTNAIKEQLDANRPVEIGFYADTSEPNETGEAIYLNQTTWAHYTYKAEEANHAVCIVGYDDNYPKENFNSVCQPSHDGAFLVKNSWGSDLEEFPNTGNGGWGIADENGKHTGYFWLSYYDQTLAYPEALNFDTTGVDEYYVNEYDYMPVTEPMAEKFTQKVSMANVFTADVSMKLSAVSCQTSTPGTEVDYQIYILADSAENPCDGVLAYETEDTYRYGGFHKCDLQDGPVIQKGQKYSVVVTQQDPDGDYAIYMNGIEGEKLAKKKCADSWGVAVVNEGESYLQADGTWRDFSEIDPTDIKPSAEGYEIDNFPIKAYGDETDQTYMYADGVLEANETGIKAYAQVKFKGTGTKEDIGDITWKSNDESVVSVSAWEDNDTYGITEYNDFGTACIAASEAELGTYVIKVIVRPKQPAATARAYSKKLKAKWDSIGNADGYRIQYRKAGGKWKSIEKGAGAKSATIKNLKKGKYSVKVAAFAKNKAGKKIYSQYSDVQTVKVK